MSQTLTAQFQALHAEREKSWDREKLRRNVEQRRALVAAYDPAKVVHVGDRIDPITLQFASGNEVTLDDLTADGPVALIFFRFAGCPACNIALPYYDQQLRPGLEAAGIKLVAISPHLPEKGLDDIRTRHDLGLTLASDRGNILGRRLGLTFVPDDNPAVPEGDQGWIGALTGTGTWELPQPAVIIVDQDHVVRFVDVSPDWLQRTEAAAVLSAAAGLRLLSAA